MSNNDKNLEPTNESYQPKTIQHSYKPSSKPSTKPEAPISMNPDYNPPAFKK